MAGSLAFGRRYEDRLSESYHKHPDRELIFYLAATSAFILLLTLFANVNYGILVTFLLKPIIDASWKVSFGGIGLLDLVGVALPVLVLARSFAPGQKLSDIPLFRIWLIFIIYNVLTYATYALVKGPLISIEFSFRVLNGFVGYYMIQTFFHDKESFRRLLLVIILAGIFPMATGIYQVLTGAVWQPRSTVGLARNVGLYHDAVTFRNYSFQTLSAVFLFWCYFLNPGRDLIKKTLLLILVGACLVVLFKIYSKAAVAIITIWIIIYCLSYKRILPVILLAVLFLGVDFLFQGQLIADFKQLFSKEVAATLENADELVYRRTLSGRWFGWEALLRNYANRSLVVQIFGNGNPSNAHNDFLVRLLSGGVIGLFIYVVLLGSIAKAILKNLRREASPLNVMAIMIFAMWLVDTMGLHPSLYPGYQWYVWGFIGLSLRGVDWQPATRPVGPEPIVANGVGRKVGGAPSGRNVPGRTRTARGSFTRNI